MPDMYMNVRDYIIYIISRYQIKETKHFLTGSRAFSKLHNTIYQKKNIIGRNETVERYKTESLLPSLCKINSSAIGTGFILLLSFKLLLILLAQLDFYFAYFHINNVRHIAYVIWTKSFPNLLVCPPCTAWFVNKSW